MDNMEDFNFKKYVLRVLGSSVLPIMTFVGAVIGVIIAAVMLGIYKDGFTERTLMYTGFLGGVLLHVLKFIVLPLIIASLISSVGVFETFFSRKIGIQFMVLVFMMKIVSVCLGIALAIFFRPGYKKKKKLFTWQGNGTSNIDSMLDILRQIFPANIIDMNLRTYRIQYTIEENASSDTYDWDFTIDGEVDPCANLLGIMTCAIILGIALTLMKSEGKPLYDFFLCVFHAIMVLLYWILWFVPLMIISLVTIQFIRWKQIYDILGKIGLCFVVMIVGFFIQCGFVYPLMYFVGTRRNPFSYMKHYIKPMLNAFATSSSSATVSISIEALEVAGINSTLVNAIIPIAHNISKDGGALYIGVASVFIAQLNKIPLLLGTYVSIVLMGGVISMVSLGIPFGTTICLVLVLDTINLPSKDIGMFLAMDFLIDRLATVVNVLGDTIILAVLEEENINLIEEINANEIG